jgi:hypothetical protein
MHVLPMSPTTPTNPFRAAARLVTAVLVFSVLASSVHSQTRLNVAKVANDFALVMGDYGNKLGIFQRNGVAPEISLITQAKMVQASIAGSVDVALASGATWRSPPRARR